MAVSALEMRQNAQREQFSAEEIEGSLAEIMRDYGVAGNDLSGANITGFLRVVHAVEALGQV